MEWVVFVQDKWSHTPHVPLYLFFGGLAAATFVVAVLADLVGLRSRRAAATARVGAYAAVPVLTLAGFFLTSHLGKPERGLAFPVFFTNYESWMTRGGWIVGSSAPLLVLYAALWYFGAGPAWRRVIGVVGIPPAVGLSFYTGFLLSGAHFVPLWSREFLPPLFATSSLNTGLAFVGLVTLLTWRWSGVQGTGPRPILRWLGAALVVLVALEAAELYRFMEALASEGLLRGRAGSPTADRFAYRTEPGGRLSPGETYVVVVTWVNNSTGAEEGASAETPVRLGAGDGQVTVTAPTRQGFTYNVYIGRTLPGVRQAAANLEPGASVTLHDLPETGLRLPENLQTGGLFVRTAGGPLAYRYLTGGPQYPWRLLGAAPAEAAVPGLRALPPTPVPLAEGLSHETLAPWFWWGVVGLALALPLALSVVEAVAELVGPGVANGVAALKCLSVLLGGLILRLVMVWGGDLKAPLVFTPSLWPVPVPGPGLLPPGVGG